MYEVLSPKLNPTFHLLSTFLINRTSWDYRCPQSGALLHLKAISCENLTSHFQPKETFWHLQLVIVLPSACVSLTAVSFALPPDQVGSAGGHKDRKEGWLGNSQRCLLMTWATTSESWLLVGRWEIVTTGGIIHCGLLMCYGCVDCEEDSLKSW